MTFTAIVVSHANERGLRSMLGNLLYQTRPPDEIVAVCSQTPDLARLREHFPARFVESDSHDDWGHGKRAHGLEIAAGDWVGFFNDDDSYDSRYLETMLAATSEDIDAVWCAWNEQPRCGFRKYQSTAGNFIVRTELARKVGWRERSYEADGVFIDALVAAGARHIKVDEILYHHNVQ